MALKNIYELKIYKIYKGIFIILNENKNLIYVYKHVQQFIFLTIVT